MTSLTISGIVSGLDTTSIIDKLVAVEGNQQTLLKNQQATQKSAVSAYSNLLSSVGSLADQVSKLASTATWTTTTAVSNDTSVTATATGSTAASLSFDVTKVAAAHTLISSGTVTSTAASVASSGSITLGKSDGTSTAINVGGGTLAEVVAGINGANLGITATAVQTSPGEYRLQVGSAKTGDSSQFTLSGIDGYSSMNVLTQGANAKIKVGSGPNAYEVQSTSNTFANVVSGVSFTVSKETTGVQVSSSVDPSKVSDQINSIVTNANNLLSSIAANTAWDSTSKKGGALLGDSTVRSLQQSVLSIVGGTAAPGLSVTSAGQLKFDADAFATAFKKDPAAVMGSYGASSTFTSAGSGLTANATYTNATAKTAAGTYAVNVVTNAKAEQWQIVPPGTGIVGRLLSITRGSTTVSYTAQAGDDNAAVAAKLNTKLAQAGMGIGASTDSGGNLVFAAANAGSASAFTASIDGGGTAAKSQAGTNIVGTIDGVATTGIGNIMTVPVTSTSRAAGLSIVVNASDADITTSGGAIGSVNYKPGLAQKLDKLFSDMSDSATGQLVTAQAQASTQVRNLQSAIDSWTTRLDAYKAMLNTKFTAMESALSSLKSQSKALTSFAGASSSDD